MKEKMKKISDGFKLIFGYGILLTLFAGGLTFFGYVAALIIGGDIAAEICTAIYSKIIPVIIYISTIMIIFGLLSMYLAGEFALTPNKKNQKNKQ